MTRFSVMQRKLQETNVEVVARNGRAEAGQNPAPSSRQGPRHSWRFNGAEGLAPRRELAVERGEHGGIREVTVDGVDGRGPQHERDFVSRRLVAR